MHVEGNGGEEGGTDGCRWGGGTDLVVRVRVLEGGTDDGGAEDQQRRRAFFVRGEFEGEEPFGEMFRVGIGEGEGVMRKLGSRA